ncbi:hypothetical protein AVEN_128583-1 [Araneus ventricosus]|uniref:Uncharacterized protein n=1 Tax=Araneus ventricosus TaxID=182803 RepID=A0A4Y2KA39_ARAVE|nr:hypothetical protein AVEN_128583-1 [Araneus ventricosus]
MLFNDQLSVTKSYIPEENESPRKEPVSLAVANGLILLQAKEVTFRINCKCGSTILIKRIANTVLFLHYFTSLSFPYLLEAFSFIRSMEALQYWLPMATRKFRGQ